MAAVPPPPHYNDHHHQHSPHLDPSTRRLDCLSCATVVAAGGGGTGGLLATPASEDDDPGDLSGFSPSRNPKADTSLRIVGTTDSKRQPPKRPDAAAAVAFLSSIAFHEPASMSAPARQEAPRAPTPSTAVATVRDPDPSTFSTIENQIQRTDEISHGASPTLVVSGTGTSLLNNGSDNGNGTLSLSVNRSPRDRAAISFLSAIDFGTFATQVVAAAGQPNSFASSEQSSTTPAIGSEVAGTLENTPAPLLDALDLPAVLASPRTFKSALASPRLSALAAARSVRQKFRLAVQLSLAFSIPSSASANPSSNSAAFSRPEQSHPHSSMDPHPLSIDTSAGLLASPTSAFGPSPRTNGRAPSLLSTTNNAHASPYPLPQSASDPPYYPSTAFRATTTYAGPRRSAYLARASSAPVAWSSLFPFDRRTALPLAPSSATPVAAAASTPVAAHATSGLMGRGAPLGGESQASLTGGPNGDPGLVPATSTPVVVGMVAVVVAAALDKAGRRTLGSGGRPAVSYASMLAPTGALCSDGERRAAAALVVDAGAGSGSLPASVTGGVLAAVSVGSVNNSNVDVDASMITGDANVQSGGGAVDTLQVHLPQANVVCDFMLARAAACLGMIADTERDFACSRRASDGSATASLDGGLGSSEGERPRNRNNMVQMVHASLVDELDQQQRYQDILPATGAATMPGTHGRTGRGAAVDANNGSSNNGNNNNTTISKPPRGTTLLQVMYDAAQLDDPALTTGRHKTVISLPGMIGSILQYTRPSELKKELNEKFRQTHPEVDPSLTLSQIRNLKRRLIDVGNNFNLEVSSLAKAFVYFEKLVLKRAVIKSNRRLVGAICLLLACKVNEPKESLNIGQLLEALAKALGKVSVKDMRDNEFAVFAQLEFNLYLPQHEFMPHFERICAIKDISSLQDYIS